VAAFWRSLYGRPYLLLVLTTLMWGGNAVASRIAVGHVSPMVITTLRWVVVCAVLIPLMAGQLAVARAELLPRWRYIFMMALLGFTGFNALMYLAAHHTTAVNITILQGSVPVLVLLVGLAWFKDRIRVLQVVGVAVALTGVAAVGAEGDPARLLTLAFNIGDLWMMVACGAWAIYTVGLRRRPKVSGFVLLTTLGGASLIWSLPLLAYEAAIGGLLWPDAVGWAVLLYVALFPSLASQILYMRGVELIGPSRAGVFVNLVPVFGALLAVAILGEPFRVYHAVALVLVLGGIALAERRAA
jgi:drug/metabolite transporter (DMT)-like permease